MFQLEPNEHQVVFEGDPLKLKCRLQISSSQKVRKAVLILTVPRQGEKFLKINVKLKIIFGATITINFLVYNIVALNLDPIIKLYDLFDK